ncbi:hypothetical protein T484DRAFT_1849998 [Baffinella frigidus]|nr:hypothetical protein T484DRAFT_1849998 [Cryptophyta sp. CCMP2293]
MQDNCMALIPSNMKPNLLGNLHNGKLRRHPVLKRLRAPGHDRFLNEDEMLADGSTEATCLYFIQLGRALKEKMQEKMQRCLPDCGHINNQNKVTTLERGDFVGAHSIFGNPIWGYELGVACDFIAESNVQCSRLTIEEFEAVLSNADPEVVEEVDEYFRQIEAFDAVLSNADPEVVEKVDESIRQYTLIDEQMENIFATS